MYISFSLCDFECVKDFTHSILQCQFFIAHICLVLLLFSQNALVNYYDFVFGPFDMPKVYCAFFNQF